MSQRVSERASESAPARVGAGEWVGESVCPRVVSLSGVRRLFVSASVCTYLTACWYMRVCVCG